jgi:hypothetical protein
MKQVNRTDSQAAKVVRAQPLIAVRDVARSSAWYQRLLSCTSAHGGNDYEMLVSDGLLILQLHAWDLEEHPNLTQPDSGKCGHGVLLWFESSAFDTVVTAARALAAEVLQEPHVNPNSRRRELWLRDLDGYVVVVAETA